MVVSMVVTMVVSISSNHGSEYDSDYGSDRGCVYINITCYLITGITGCYRFNRSLYMIYITLYYNI